MWIKRNVLLLRIVGGVLEGFGEMAEATGQVDGLYGVEAVRGLVDGGSVVVRHERIVR